MAQQGPIARSEYQTVEGVRMTPKQTAFVKEYVETLNSTESAMRVYDVKDRNVAKTIGSQNLSKLNTPINQLLDKAGLTEEYIVNKIKEKTNAKDVVFRNNKAYQADNHAIQLKAIEMAAKIRKMFPKEGVEISGVDGGAIIIKVKEDRELIQGETVDDSNEETNEQILEIP